MTLNSNQQLTIGFIGAGNMAAAIARGLVKQGHPAESLMLSNPSKAKLNALQAELGVAITSENQQICDRSNLVILAVKPQKMTEAISALEFKSDQCIVSVAAGINTEKLRQLTGQQKVIRAMPNTPAIELCGATGLFAEPEAKLECGSLAEYVFGAVGTYQWIDDEQLMDTVTAIAGSSPAYFFRFMEGLIEAARKQGMPEQTARHLVVHSALGAASLIANHPETAIATRREQVTSPGGTTAAALEAFEQGDLMALINSAVEAAVNRGKQLANE